MTEANLRAAIEKSVRNTMAEIGLTQFKSMSFFMSNESRCASLKKAA